MIQAKSLIRGELILGEKPQKNISPLDGSEASQSDFLSIEQLKNVFEEAKKIKNDED